MATLGLKDLVMAKVTEDTDGKETFGTPKTLAKAIMADLSVNVAEGTLYADDAIDAIEKQFVNGTIKLGINDLGTETTAELLGQSVDDDGVIYGEDTDEPPYFAIGFRARKSGKGKYRYIWLYKVKFKIPNDKFETKGDSINFITPEIEGTFVKLNKNGRWKSDYTGIETDNVAKTWFDSVKEKAEVTEV